MYEGHQQACQYEAIACRADWFWRPNQLHGKSAELKKLLLPYLNRACQMIATLRKYLTSVFPALHRKKKKLFIHAGTHKTGTTYFQHVMYQNKEALRAGGLYYPVTGLGINTPHNKYAHRLLGIRLASGHSNAFPTIIKALVDDNRLTSGLVSYEGFTRPATIEKLQAESACFAPVELHGILVFRPHIDFALSLYRELCQHVGFSAPFSELMGPTTDTSKGWRRSLNYSEIMQGWLALTGHQNLHVFSYRRIKPDLITALIAPTGFKGNLETPPQAERNKTLSAPLAALMRRLGQQNFKAPLRHKLAAELSALDRQFPDFGRYCEISQDEAISFEQSFQADRDFLKDWGFDGERDLLLSGDWRWGEDTNMAAATDQAHEALIDQLKKGKKPKMLAVAEASWAARND